MGGICEIHQKWYIPLKRGWRRSRIRRLNTCQKCCTTLADVLSFVAQANENLCCYNKDDLKTRAVSKIVSSYLCKLGKLMKALYIDLGCGFQNLLFSCFACIVKFFLSFALWRLRRLRVYFRRRADFSFELLAALCCRSKSSKDVNSSSSRVPLVFSIRCSHSAFTSCL
ncbi:hypothetical protein TELCIR_24014 [Teladorsagia circumcincta]|uniref:Uncharacterized protein n=1 Tax=Teladorsagia circumcincta TaxID=45464 RepID=A0A2G9T9H0_TELCI|nr:hypothetical protein TELCIR_24014 [Teladorsagia circumcincta]